MGLHLSVKPPPFRNLVQYKKQSERLLHEYLVRPGSLRPLLGGLWIVFRLRAGTSALCSPILQGLLQIPPRPVGGRLAVSVEALFCCDEICCQVITESLWKGFMMDRRSALPYQVCTSRWDSPERTVPRSFSESSRPFPERLPLLQSDPHLPLS